MLGDPQHALHGNVNGIKPSSSTHHTTVSVVATAKNLETSPRKFEKLGNSPCAPLVGYAYMKKCRES